MFKDSDPHVTEMMTFLIEVGTCCFVKMLVSYIALVFSKPIFQSSQNFEAAPQGINQNKDLVHTCFVKKTHFLALYYVFSQIPNFCNLKNLRLIFSDFGGVVFLLLEAIVFSHHRVAAPFSNCPDHI